MFGSLGKEWMVAKITEAASPKVKDPQLDP